MSERQSSVLKFSGEEAARLRPEVRAAVAGARERLFSLQRPDGHWCGELEGDTILESEYVLLLHYLGRLGEDRASRAAAYLRDKQLEDGSWGLFPGGPGDVSVSAKAYFALKLVGDDPGAPHMERARSAILELGGLDACNSFTKIYLSIFGQYSWDDAPAVPPELVLFPKWFPFNIYAISSWSRAIVVPLGILWAHKPSREVPEGRGVSELRATAWRKQPGRGGRIWRAFFHGVDRLIKWVERRGWLPMRRRALECSESWVLERLQGSDGLGAIFPPIVNTIIALDCLGYSHDDAIFRAQVLELERFGLEENGRLRLQPCFSPVWDTCLALTALGVEQPEEDRPKLERCVDWLLDKEVTTPGDWQVRNPRGPVGGWFFEYANPFYPDNDDTAQILRALLALELSGERAERVERAAERGFGWLLSMQNRDGGWAAFDKHCDREYLTHIPFADHNAMIDPSTTDVTSRVLEALAWRGADRGSRPVRRAVAFVKRMQEDDGSWYGRWGVNYLYGTWLALTGLVAIEEDPRAEWGRRAVSWLLGRQNEDGGWGELPTSYADPALKGVGPSTAAQTAWAVLGLIAAGEGDSPAVRRGVEYLLETRQPDGGWHDEWWTGTGFPQVFYLRYHYYALYFPLLALSRFSEVAYDRPPGPRRIPA